MLRTVRPWVRDSTPLRGGASALPGFGGMPSAAANRSRQHIYDPRNPQAQSSTTTPRPPAHGYNSSQNNAKKGGMGQGGGSK